TAGARACPGPCPVLPRSRSCRLPLLGCTTHPGAASYGARPRAAYHPVPYRPVLCSPGPNPEAAMGRRILVLMVALGVVAVAACSRGPVRRISEPAAQIQQLAVQADGRWTVSLRLQNYSSIPMRFDRVELELAVGGEAAGALREAVALEIGPESADVVELPLDPTSPARMLLADALASGRGVDYALKGRVEAGPADRSSSRSYPIDRKSALSPAPGLPGVLR